jgi:hypothetical protein
MSRIYKICITLAAVAALWIAHQGIMDSASMDYTNEGFKRVLITYAVARSLNGIISVAQGTELAIEPAGIGLTFTPGEILDPVNDLIERFSWVMLASGTAFGIQRILLEVTAWQTFTLLTSVIVLLAVILAWWPGANKSLLKISCRIAAVMLILRFAVPVLAMSSEGIYRVFLAPIYQGSSRQLQEIAVDLDDLNEQVQAETQPADSLEDDSFIGNARQRLSAFSRQINIQKRIDAFMLAAENISETAINLIVIFIIQTIILPLLAAWLVLQLLKQILFGR